ncbi:HNH endonuclease [Novosphingobium sp. NBM11]|uniref:HNH endonuclease n=2 Tax=unclassified Novosphingobium TaxID=2644732 RepID=UPI0018925036|nr:HNH endonuclease [Novosphingobium sp. NBM11]
MCKIATVRRQKFDAQDGLCFYCKQPMWEHDPHQFSERFAVCDKRLGWLRSTAEHLRARCEGGKNTGDNIVAACLFCNSRRHRSRNALPPETYGRRVRKRLAKGQWHGLQLHPFC